jgi:hypothetical protein
MNFHEALHWIALLKQVNTFQFWLPSGNNNRHFYIKTFAILCVDVTGCENLQGIFVVILNFVTIVTLVIIVRWGIASHRHL